MKGYKLDGTMALKCPHCGEPEHPDQCTVMVPTRVLIDDRVKRLGEIRSLPIALPVNSDAVEKLEALLSADDLLDERDIEIARLRLALATVLGDATHGQNMTWEERCRIGRDALERR